LRTDFNRAWPVRPRKTGGSTVEAAAGRFVAPSPTVGKKHKSKLSRTLETASEQVTAWTGSNAGFGTAAAIIVVWGLSGPVFGFSDTWQLVINTGTTIVTFLMVFLIQRSQNKESLALQLKLNELVAALQGASNRLIDVEGLTEDELLLLKKHYIKLAHLAAHDFDLGKSHSVEEAEHRHQMKRPQHLDAGGAAK
jgi:low affinity Fe/Cu permease